jgi:hypothetical protein
MDPNWYTAEILVRERLSEMRRAAESLRHVMGLRVSHSASMPKRCCPASLPGFYGVTVPRCVRPDHLNRPLDVTPGSLHPRARG